MSTAHFERVECREEGGATEMERADALYSFIAPQQILSTRTSARPLQLAPKRGIREASAAGKGGGGERAKCDPKIRHFSVAPSGGKR